MSSRTCRATLALATVATAIAIPFTLASAAYAGPPLSYQCMEGPRIGSVTIDGDVNPATVGTGCTPVGNGENLMIFKGGQEPFICNGVIFVEGAAAGQECHSPE
jgi:hypothetical protein